MSLFSQCRRFADFSLTLAKSRAIGHFEQIIVCFLNRVHEYLENNFLHQFHPEYQSSDYLFDFRTAQWGTHSQAGKLPGPNSKTWEPYLASPLPFVPICSHGKIKAFLRLDLNQRLCLNHSIIHIDISYQNFLRSFQHQNSRICLASHWNSAIDIASQRSRLCQGQWIGNPNSRWSWRSWWLIQTSLGGPHQRSLASMALTG